MVLQDSGETAPLDLFAVIVNEENILVSYYKIQIL